MRYDIYIYSHENSFGFDICITLTTNLYAFCLFIYSVFLNLLHKLRNWFKTRFTNYAGRHAHSRSTLEVPIFWFIYGEPLFVDKHYQAKALSDMVIVVQSETSSWESHLQCNGKPLLWDLRSHSSCLILRPWRKHLWFWTDSQFPLSVLISFPFFVLFCGDLHFQEAHKSCIGCCFGTSGWYPTPASCLQPSSRDCYRGNSERFWNAYVWCMCMWRIQKFLHL